MDQINNSPEPLRSYICDLETSVGSIADLVQYTAGLEESVRLMELLLMAEQMTVNHRSKVQILSNVHFYKKEKKNERN